MTVIDTFYTTAGTLITSTFLVHGDGYTLVEVEAPEGYVLDPTPVPFDISKENASEESGITVVVIEKKNDH